MRARAVRWMVLAAALSSFATPAALAETELSSACFVGTPLYQKLLGAGVLSVPIEAPLAKQEPALLLFLKARLIHYSWDRMKMERWQSADETSRAFSGSCADKAIWLYTHMRRNGYKNTTLIIGRYSPSSKVLHMWVTYQAPDGSVMLLDPTIQKKPWRQDAFPGKFYKRQVIIDGSSCVGV